MMFYGSMIILTEWSTPFVNFRWFFDVCDMKGHILYAVNGIMMWITFLVFRVAWLPVMVIHILINREKNWSGHFGSAYWILAGTVVTHGLSTFWFYLITKGLLKHVLGSKTPEETDDTKKPVKTD